MYLTHSGQLTFSSGKLSLLDRQVRDYASLAMECQDDMPGLVAALFEYSLDILGAFDTGLGEAALRDMLAFDIDLNAQGLALWRDKLAS